VKFRKTVIERASLSLISSEIPKKGNREVVSKPDFRSKTEKREKRCTNKTVKRLSKSQVTDHWKPLCFLVTPIFLL
jgi:hypothetical protein